MSHLCLPSLGCFSLFHQNVYWFKSIQTTEVLGNNHVLDASPVVHDTKVKLVGG